METFQPELIDPRQSSDGTVDDISSMVDISGLYLSVLTDGKKGKRGRGPTHLDFRFDIG